MRGCRGWAIAILFAGVLAGCGNFSLSGILDALPPDAPPPDAPPAGPRALTLVPVTVNIPLGAQVKFTAQGGVPPYTWAEDTNGTDGYIDSAGLYKAPATPGTYTVSVTDSAGAHQEATVFASATVPLSIHPVTISIAAGGSITFSASGGSGSYSWSKVGGAGSLGGSTYTAPFAAETATIRVTDSDVPPTSVDATVTVSAPLPLQISPAAATVIAGSTVIFSATGGSGSYSWSKVGGAGSLAGSSYTAPGSAETATIRLTDTITTNTRDATVTVTDPPVVLTISPSTVTLNAGQAIAFSAGGGTTPYAYTKVAGAGSLVGSTYTAPFTAETATIRVTDSDTPPTSVVATVTVNAPPPLVITPGSISVVTNATATFSASGGAPGYTYSVLSGGAGGSIGAGGVYTAPAAAGTDTVRVTDQASRTSDAAVTVYFPLTIVPTTVTVQTGTTYPFGASGGVPPYLFSSESGVGTMDSDGLYHANGGPGGAVVKVVDSIGNASTAVVTIEAPVGGWTIVSIDASSKSGQYASLALDGAGDPRIAYYESQGKELRLATWNATAWSIATVDSTDRPGQYASLALESGTGRPRISHYEAKNANLMYADWNGSSWATATIDSTDDVGQYASLALQPGSNYPRIAYYDATNKDLKYAAWNGSIWTMQTVGTADDVGQYASLALDGSGQPRIAYYDATNKDLKYAAWNGSSWTIQTVEGVGDVGQFASLALEPGSNYPRIAYYDATNKDLKYAAWNGSSWTIQTVEGVGDVGQFASLALEPGSNYPRIAYYDATNKDLKYVENNGGWGIPEIVDSASDVGKFASLRLDPGTGKPRIAYYNPIAQDLKFAKKL